MVFGPLAVVAHLESGAETVVVVADPVVVVDLFRPLESEVVVVLRQPTDHCLDGLDLVVSLLVVGLCMPLVRFGR